MPFKKRERGKTYSAHPLDEHERAANSVTGGDWDHLIHVIHAAKSQLFDMAAAVLRVELIREPSDKELLAACAAYIGDEASESYLDVGPIRRALKAAMATRLKRLGLDK